MFWNIIGESGRVSRFGQGADEKASIEGCFSEICPGATAGWVLVALNIVDKQSSKIPLIRT